MIMRLYPIHAYVRSLSPSIYRNMGNMVHVVNDAQWRITVHGGTIPLQGYLYL